MLRLMAHLAPPRCGGATFRLFRASLGRFACPSLSLPALRWGRHLSSGLRHGPALPRLGAAFLGVVLLLSIVGLARGRAGRDVGPYTVVVEQRSLAGVVIASGEVRPVREVNVGPRVSGRVLEILVEESDQVEAGQAMAVMDGAPLRNRVAERRALLAQARGNVARTADLHGRWQGLVREGAISQQDFQGLTADLQRDEAALQAAEERLQQLLTEQDDLVVRAPFGGKVLERFADPGATVAPTTSASNSAGANRASILALGAGMEVVARVPESDVGRIVEGQQALVRIDAYPDRSYAATVKGIATRARTNNNVIAFDVMLRFTASDTSAIRYGMTGDISFDTGRLAPASVIPTVAVVTERGQPGVYAVGRNRQPRFQPVVLGTSSGSSTQILEGVEPGERIFIDLPPWSGRRLN
ncbi:MAG: efflux RND transporter periplasmic adaptor subunit [Aphanocapsa feldmannii 277cV]|uniref:Efflux RND transporter periplasmic adaptor subunit n=1 Tax=Aphanocapsa feldmannii 277cV TaxID=2507553 RepID=A0A524RQT8_9CHRO|nr:MAG: efflux RND transporter periplasmic adaptor subunit [Aphanocapsa feldmannii 277cV]